MRFTIKNRLILFLILILATAFILISILNYTAAREAITDEIRTSSLPLLRENIYSEIQQDLLPAVNIASMMATDSFLKNWTLRGEQNTEEVVQYLREIRDKYNYTSTFFVSDTTKNYYFFDGVLKKVSPADSHDIWYYKFVASNKEYDLDVDTDQADRDELTIFVNYRLSGYMGNLLGVTGVGITMNDFSRFLREKQEKYKRRIYLTDHDGLVQAHSDPEKIERENITVKPGISSIAHEILVTQEHPLDSSYEGENGRVLITSRYIPEIDWFLIVEQNEETALASTRNSLIRTVVIGLAASILIILLITLTVNRFHARLEELATTDSLTGCANRRELEKRVERMLIRRTRYGNQISLILIDVDNFKALNDTRGHQQGDEVLRTLAKTVEASIRPDDLLARWGGDEFVIVLEAGLDEARNIAERLRYLFSQSWNNNHPEGPRTSLSMGIAELQDNDALADIIKKADSALYQAKKSGRDCIRLYS